MKVKKRLCVSFSMGESSGMLTNYCLEKLYDEYEIVVVVANTGEEREESLVFADKCDKYFGWNLVWVECITNPIFGEGVRAKVVTFETAARNGEPFEGVISKYGIPNQKFPHCSREMKEYTVKAYLRDCLGWTDYYVAIGIRHDEQHRIKWETAKKNQWIYPLVTHIIIDKPRVNIYWNTMPFRLTIKSYEGNCKACWKFSLRKQLTKVCECPKVFDFTKIMEFKYGDYVPEHRKKEVELPIRFFRGNRSVDDLFEEAKLPFIKAKDERLLVTIQTHLFDEPYEPTIFDEELDESDICGETCEAFQT